MAGRHGSRTDSWQSQRQGSFLPAEQHPWRFNRSGLVQFRVTLLALEIVLVLGFSTVSITSTASLSTSTKTGQAGCYPYRHLCEPGHRSSSWTREAGRNHGTLQWRLRRRLAVEVKKQQWYLTPFFAFSPNPPARPKTPEAKTPRPIANNLNRIEEFNSCDFLQQQPDLSATPSYL